jgi:hypothetical protein
LRCWDWPATGAVTALYNGQRYEGNPREIPLAAHSQIQLDVGRPLVAPMSSNFPLASDETSAQAIAAAPTRVDHARSGVGLIDVRCGV